MCATRSAPTNTFFSVDSPEAYWNTGRAEEGGNMGYKVPIKGGYFPVSPADKYADVRDEMSRLLEEVGLTIERAHHEVGSGGQQEINYRFATLQTAADDMMKFKYVIKNSALDFGHFRDLHAQAPLWRQRLGHAHPHLAVEERRAPCSTTSAATVRCPTRLAGSSAVCSSTPRRCWPSRTRR